MYHDADGKLVEETSVEVDGVFRYAQQMMDIQDDTGGANNLRYRGSIDPITAKIWAKECGAAIYSKEWMAHARKKIDSGDYALFFPKSRRKTA